MNVNCRSAARNAYRRRVAVVVALLLAVAPAQASMFAGETLDAVANGVAWVALIVGPIVAIVVFWLVHILPEKIAEQRRHPQAKAIQTLCILSLFFGGLLWPLAWLWAYTKPVAYRGAYGTERHDDYFHEMGEKAQKGDLLEHELAHLRDELDAMAARGTLTAELKVLRRDLAAARAASAAPAMAQAAPAAAPIAPAGPGAKAGGA